MTQAEYDALSYEDKHNGNVYFITDAGHGSGDFAFIQNGDCYSTEERMIGCWIDGKPLYQKTIDCGAFPNTTQKQVPHNIADVDKIWVKEIGGYVTNGTQFFVTNRATSPAQYSWDISASRTHIIVEDYANFSNDLTAVVTVLYTKTIDTPGSGAWIPNGMPATHYSTSEQIIGTWIDGSTLYEKSFDLSSNPVTLSRGNWVNVVQLADVSKIIDATAVYNNMKLAAIEFSYDAGYVTAQWVANSSDTRRITYLTVRYTKS